jgi:regulator of sigma E protease
MISWIPLGGYVKMAGMVDESMDNKPLTGAPWEFMSKNFGQKLFAISGGVLMNIILAFFLYTGITYFGGITETGAARIGAVEKGMPADSAGLRPGDLIISIDGDSIASWRDMANIIHQKPDTLVCLVWMREGKAMSAIIRSSSQKWIVSGKSIKIGLIGISPEMQSREAGFIESIVIGTQATFFVSASTVIAIAMLVKGEAGIKDFVGPVGIVHYSGESIKSGFEVFLGFIALISVNIGLLNILPIPALDGGHIVYIFIESIIRRPISTRVKLIIQQIGMALILLLLLIISYNDVMRFFLK